LFHSVFLRHLLEYTVFRALYSEPIVLIFYGLYFSVLVRDAAELCAEQMAFQIEQSRTQFYVNETTLSRTCGICDGGFEHDRDLEGVAVVMKQEYIADNKNKLECGHYFHEFCLKGWSIIGKKEYCPVCKEKVNIKDHLSKNPWETDSVAWIQFLDIVRYVLVWNPLIIMVLQVLLWVIKV
jgi:RING finger protein 121